MSGGVPGAPPVKCFPHSAGVIFAKVGRSDAPTTGQRRTVTEAGHRPRRRLIGRRVCAPTRRRRSGGRVALTGMRVAAPAYAADYGPRAHLRRLSSSRHSSDNLRPHLPGTEAPMPICASCTGRSRSVQGWCRGCRGVCLPPRIVPHLQRETALERTKTDEDM